MTNIRPNALTLSVAIAISSSMIGTQALADRRLQTKSVDIHGNGHVEFIQSEVIVQPTLDDDQQPIPKSFTTTYPDQTEVRAGYDIPSEGFTDVLSGFEGGVSIVDQFETDENNVAQKYTKVLKVGNEGVFRFTHNLAERKLLIEVRDRMTHQDSIKAVRVQSGNTQTLEPFTKVASPEHLVGVLKGVHERAGNLGEVDNYFALATLEVDKVKVEGRTFMRLIAAGDRPPELQRLGQSLFVDEEVLLAAATSAYTQVHVLGEEVQQQALNELLSYHKPVGYVVHVEDDTQPYPVPEGYPKLEVTEAPGEIIVFRSQKQNPTDLAFVQGLNDMWAQESGYCPPSQAKTQIKKDKVKSYQYIIRSRQMALLEGLAAVHNAGLEEDGEMTLAYDHDLMTPLSQYEYLHQALASANSDGADEFELTIGQIEIASSVVTSTWMQNQLKKYFSFKPAFRNLLTNQFFIQNIHEVIADDSDIIRVQADDPGDGEEFASNILSDKPSKLIEIKVRQEELLAKERELTLLRNQLKLTTEKTSTNAKEQLRALQLRQQIEDKLIQFHQELGQQKNQIQTLQRQVNRIPTLEKKLSNIRAYALLAHFSVTASRLGIDDWIDNLPLEMQSRRISERINEIFRVYAATGEPDEEALKAKPAAIGGERGIAPVSKKNLAILQSIQQQLHQALGRPELLDSEKLTTFEGQLGITNSQHDPLERRRTILQHLKHQAIKIFQTHIQNQQEHQEPKKWLQKLLQEIEQITELKQEAHDASAGDLKVRNAQIAMELGIDYWDVTQPLAEQARIIRKKILEIKQLAAATAQPDKGAVKAKASTNEDDLASLQFIRPPKQQRLQQNEEPTDGEIRERLAFYEGKLDLVPENEDDLEARNLGLQQRIMQLSIEIHQQNIENQQKLAKRSTWLHFLQEEVDRIPILRKKTREVTAAAIQDYNTQIAAKLGIDNWDGTQTLEAQTRLINQKINEIKQAAAATSATATLIIPTSVTATPIASTSIVPKPVISTPVATTLVAATSVAATEQTQEEAVKAELASIERQPGLVPENEKDPQACCRAIQQHHKEQQTQTDQQYLQQQSITTDAEKEAEIKAFYATIAVHCDIKDFDSNADIEVRTADIERMKAALKLAEKAVENDGGPFQYTPGQVEVLTDMYDFIHQHALKKQALEAAMGLAASAAKSGKVIPELSTFDFDDEFAPIRLQAKVGKDLTFHQASRIATVFRNLKRSFPLSSVEPVDNQPQNVLEEVGILVQRIRNELGKGPQQYDEIINGMGKMAIHFVKYEEEDLKSFLEYFATRSATGNRIIALLREGLISKIELENYIKAVRGVNGYQTVAEFEHFLGDKQGVKVLEFRKVIQMLSDEGAEQFMKIAITPVTLTATGPAGMKESVDGMKEYAAAVIANYVLDDIAFENGRRTAAFLANVQETLTPYANAAGLSESELIQAIHDTLMQAHAAAVEQELTNYWIKPSAFLVQAVTWYYASYKPLLITHTARQAAEQSAINMSFLYLLDLTNRGDYLHRMLTPFQHWLERYGVDPDRTGQYAYHNVIEQVSEVGGLAMPLGKAAASVILLKTGSILFARQYNANPQMYRSISRLVPEIVKSMGSRQGVQVPLLHRVTPQKVKTLASTTAALVLGPVATVGAYAHGLISGFTYAQTFGFALASSLTFDFFMNDNKMLTQWLGGPLGRSLDKFNRWRGMGESDDDYVKRTAIAAPQYFSETDDEYAYRVKANNTMYGWTRHENYLQFRERRDRTIKLFENGWEKYFRENVPKWSFSHAKSIPYSYTLGTFYEWGDKKMRNFSR
ncbi:hypothetical protein [Endozoicomonas sp. ALC020]|uniref:hypothetical protein n=1 Tax=unclassified Endozoicomonas TaxID=2644528 RepID=UPI003BAF2D32